MYSEAYGKGDDILGLTRGNASYLKTSARKEDNHIMYHPFRLPTQLSPKTEAAKGTMAVASIK